MSVRGYFNCLDGNTVYEEPDPQHMCGDGRIEIVDGGPEAPHMRAKYVRFTDGGHTNWHYHTCEQLLLATDGRGFVECRGQPKFEMRKGDRVIIHPEVWHRHGAIEGESFLHLAVTCGETIWEE